VADVKNNETGRVDECEYLHSHARVVNHFRSGQNAAGAESNPMSTQSASTRRPSVFAAVLLFPFRAVERTRGWRRLGLLALYVAIALPILALLWRRSQLAGLPDVGAPLDGASSSNSRGVPEDRNAFVSYRQAVEKVRDMTRGESDSFAKANLEWSKADAVLRGWVAENQEAISLLRVGAERPEASLDLPGIPAGPFGLAEKQQLILKISWICDAALFDAGRLRAEGDRAGAWALFKAAIRASRDMERALPTAGCRTVAFTVVQYARGPVSEWAQDPSVGVELLRQALLDLAAAQALTPPLSAFYRGEYQAAEDSLVNLHLFMAERSRADAADGRLHLSTLAPNLDAFLRGEPERSRRVLRLLAANDLAWCGQSERPAFAVPRLRIYQADPAAPPAARALPPDELARWAGSTLINPAQPWRMGDLELFDKTDHWSLGMLKEMVAVALFSREMGRKPASPAEALRHYLPLPGDTPDRDEAQPLPERAGKWLSR
jgi:hypothetical protein